MGSWWQLSLLLVATSACVFGAGNKAVKKRSKDKIRWFEEKDQHEGRLLANDDFVKLSSGDEPHFWKILDQILIPRVVGSEGHKQVREYLVRELDALNWTVEQDSFEAPTPIGRKTFTNVIATLDPSAQRRLVLACHYDSKLTPTGFLGAIDSAAPCSMLVNLAHVLQKELNEHKTKKPAVTLQLLFFDGEEAFHTWSETDSLYGARHMAAKMNSSQYPLGGPDNTNELQRMDLFVLLDLIGTHDCEFVNFFRNTQKWYSSLGSLERTFSDLSLSHARHNFLIRDRRFNSVIEDDHIPFLRRGVPILHLICVPFSTVWHTLGDNRNALDEQTIENVNMLMRAFVFHYLHLNLP